MYICLLLSPFFQAFEETMTEFGMTLQWMTASPNTRKTILMKLSDRLELTSKLLRMKAARAVLYIAQVRNFFFLLESLLSLVAMFGF